MKYSSTTRLINVIIFAVLAFAFGFLGIYQGFLVAPFLSLRNGPVGNVEIGYGLSAMLGVTGIAGLLISGYGLVTAIMSLLHEKDDQIVRRSFGAYIALGYAAAMFFFFNATWLYRLTSTNIGYDEFGFVIAVYAILFLISIIVSNIPLIRMYGESEELNSIMRIIVGSLLAITLAITLVFGVSYFLSLNNSIYQQAVVSRQFLIGALVFLVAALLSCGAFLGYGRSAKAGVISKVNGFLFEGSLICVGGGIIAAGALEYVNQSPKKPLDVSFVAKTMFSTNGSFMEFSIMAFILGGLIVILGLFLCSSTLKGSKQK